MTDPTPSGRRRPAAMLVHLVKGAVAVAAAAGVLPGALCAQDSSASPKASPSLATALAPSPVPLYPVLPTPVLPVRQLPAGVGFSGYLSARQTRRNDSTTFVVNRARITVMGAPLPYLAFRLQGDLSTAGRVAGDSTVPSSALTDAYVQLTVPRGGRSGIAERFAPALVVGQFKTPLSLEYLTSFSLLKTANRAQVVDRLATKRDVGALAQVGVGPWVTVAGAVTDGEGPNATRNPDNQELAVGRLTLRPVPWLAVAGKWAGQGPDHLWGYDARLVRGAATVEGEALHRTGRVPGAAAPATGPAYAAGGGYVLAAYRVLPWLEPVAKWERFREERAAQAGGTPFSETWLTFGATARAPDDRVRFQVNWVEKRAHSVARDANELVAQLIAIY